MKRSLVSDAEVFQGAPVRLQNRIVKSDQTDLLLADVSTFTLKVISGTSVIVVHNAISPTGYFQSSLQTGNGWSRDGIGYSFQYILTPSGFINGASGEQYEGGKTYRLEFSAVSGAGATLAKWVWNVKVLTWAG
jgi:hypothetical protein